MNESKEQFKNGNLYNSVATIQEAFKTKNTLYYLEMGQVQRLLGPSQIPNSIHSLRIADAQVERWEIETNERLKKSFSDVSSYLLSEGLNSEYDPKLYEIILQLEGQLAGSKKLMAIQSIYLMMMRPEILKILTKIHLPTIYPLLFMSPKERLA